jgi:hypothetical protein
VIVWTVYPQLTFKTKSQICLAIAQQKLTSSRTALLPVFYVAFPYSLENPYASECTAAYSAILTKVYETDLAASNTLSLSINGDK